MPYLITRMPSTGSITNIAHDPRPVADVQATWADTDCVTVYSDEEYAALPTCETCGNLRAECRCNDCR